VSVVKSIAVASKKKAGAPQAPRGKRREDPMDGVLEHAVFDDLFRAAWDEGGVDHLAASFRKRFAERPYAKEIAPARGSDDTIRNAHLVATFLAATVVHGSASGGLLLAKMAKLVREPGADDGTKGIALKSCLGLFEWAKKGWTDPARQWPVLHALPVVLAPFDVRFESLTSATMRKWLSRKHETPRLAAELTFSCRAFGFKSADAARKAFYAAAKLSV